MQTPPLPEAPRHSAFAAAAFSFLFPGLGHAYLREWSRALAWATLPILGIALVAGLLVNPTTRDQLEGWLLEPDVLMGVLALLVVDLLYRLGALLDAYRIARTPGTGALRGMASAAGLLAVLFVLVASHVAVARPVLIAHDALAEITGGTDDPIEGPIDSGLLASFRDYTPPPTASPDPSYPAEPTPSPEPTPTQGPAWDEGGRLSILLVGADAGRAGYGGYLTDTMITVTIDTKTKQVAFITLPRDTSGIPIPRSWPAYSAFGGSWPYKANEVFTYAARISPSRFPGPTKNKGFNALKGMLGELYGLRIDYFVAVDLKSFREIINALGGVVVDVQNPVAEDAYPADDGTGHVKLYVPPGIQYMTGREALAYARSRHTTSDFDRSARQTRVITSVREQLDLSSLLAPGVLNKMIRTFKSSIRTDIPTDKVPKLVQLAQEIDLDKRISLVLDPPDYSRTCYPCPPNGLWVLKANVPKIRRDVAGIFRKDRAEVQRAQDIKAEGALVHVLNGTSARNLRATRIADHLASLGINALVPPINGGAADRTDYTDTVIVAYNGAEELMPVTIRVLENLFKVTVTIAEDPGREEDIVLIVGSQTVNPR